MQFSVLFYQPDALVIHHLTTVMELDILFVVSHCICVTHCAKQKCTKNSRGCVNGKATKFPSSNCFQIFFSSAKAFEVVLIYCEHSAMKLCTSQHINFSRNPARVKFSKVLWHLKERVQTYANFPEIWRLQNCFWILYFTPLKSSPEMTNGHRLVQSITNQLKLWS